jgi:Tfp pilus assembly protein FimT
MKLHPRQSNGWTLIELLVLIAILALIFSLVPCAPRGARTRARQVAWLNNLKQIAFAHLIYAAEHDGKLPFEISTNRSFRARARSDRAPRWSNGNAMAFLLTGTGHRTADSTDDVGAWPATLTLSYWLESRRHLRRIQFLPLRRE